MKTQTLLLCLTVANAALLVFSVTQARTVAANDIVPVLRGRALEILDDHGRVRAELKVFPAQPTFKMPDGTVGFPEAVQLRLFTSKGGPNVKLVTTEDGSGQVLGSDSGYVQILSRESPFLKLVTKDGRQQTIKP